MSLDKLQKFIEKKKKETTETKINWENKKKEWLKTINKLYEDIETWLKDLDVTITYEDIELFERYLGSYKAKKMILDIGGEKVELKPIGTLIIGAKGRVDMEGPRGKVKIVLVPKDSQGPIINVKIFSSEIESRKQLKEKREEITEWEWKIATSPPGIKYIELNQDTFSDVLLGVLGAD